MLAWPKGNGSSDESAIEHPYGREFELEIESWCYGLCRIDGRVLPATVHKILKEVARPIRRAIREGYFFDIHDIAENLSEACNRAVGKKEILFSLLVNVTPGVLDNLEIVSLAKLIADVERVYGSEVDRLKKVWHFENKSGAFKTVINSEQVQAAS